MPKEQSFGRKLLAFALVGVFLLAFPVASVYLSKSGLDRYKAIKANLKLYTDSIVLPEYYLPELNAPAGQNIYDITLGRACLLQILPEDISQAKKALDYLKERQDALIKEDKERFAIISFVRSDSNLRARQAFLSQVQADTSNWRLLEVPANTWEQTQVELHLQNASPNSILLIDYKGYLADVFDLEQEGEDRRLFESLAVLIPKEERKRIEYKSDVKLYE